MLNAEKVKMKYFPLLISPGQESKQTQLSLSAGERVSKPRHECQSRSKSQSNFLVCREGSHPASHARMTKNPGGVDIISDGY